MRRNLAQCVVLFLVFSSVSNASVAKNESNLAPHTHGEGKLIFVLDLEKQEAQIEFKIPALQVLGFERKPKTELEKKTHVESQAMLKVPTNIFTLLTDKNSKSECVFGKSILKIPYLEDHAHHEHNHGEEHADYELNYKVTCKNIKAVRGFKIEAFKSLKGLDKLKAEGFVGDKPISREIKAEGVELLF